MKIGIQTWGSDGDIRPFAALAGGFSQAGHEVTLVFTSVDNKDYADLAANLGFRLRRAHDRFDLNDAVLARLRRAVMRERLPVKQVLTILECFFTDQIFWGRELHRLGVAPRPLHRRSLTAARLARAIRAVLATPAMHQKAAAMGRAMSRENGVATAVRLIAEL